MPVLIMGRFSHTTAMSERMFIFVPVLFSCFCDRSQKTERLMQYAYHDSHSLTVFSLYFYLCMQFYEYAHSLVWMVLRLLYISLDCFELMRCITVCNFSLQNENKEFIKRSLISRCDSGRTSYGVLPEQQCPLPSCHFTIDCVERG